MLGKRLALIGFLSIGLRSAPEETLVAVASNFAGTFRVLSRQFETSTGLHIVPVFGSTGKHYAQIRNGAPFHAFLAADRERPELLEKEGHTIPGTRFTYAVGQIVLLCPQQSCSPGQEHLKRGDFRNLAIANPKLAPYGKAAIQALQALGVWDQLRDRLVFGQNIAQTFHFVKSGSASLGIVAYSQLGEKIGNGESDEVWQIPHDLYDPIEQQAVLLRESEMARRFLEYLKSDEARRVIVSHGYSAPIRGNS